MAYKTGIEVYVKGAEQVARMRKRIEDLQKTIDKVGNLNGGSLDVYNQQLEITSKILNRVSQGTKLETKAIKLQARALINANDARARTNDLVDKQIKLQRALNQTEEEFFERTQASARAAAAKSAEFIRQQRIAKQIAADLANAPAPQLLLAPGAPGGPAMSGGARRRITGPTERLGGARTLDQAAVTLRFAEALKEQIRPLSQVEALFAGITGEANRLSKVKALPSAEMLGAAAKGLQRLENAEERRNRELKESADRLKEIDRLEASRARRAKKLQDRAAYFADREGAGGGRSKPPGRTGVQRFAEFGLGAGFPLLFGGGAGQVLGGALGTAVGGGGPAGFGLQIAFSAIGGQVEDALGRIAEMDKALQALNMDALADSAIVVNAELRETVQNLVDMGENQKAVELATAEVSMQTGVLPGSIKDASDSVNLLSNVWDEFVGRVSGLIALIGTPLLNALSMVLKLVSEMIKPFNFILSLILQSGNNLEGVNEIEEKRLATLRQTGQELEKELGREKEILEIESRRASGTTAAAKLNNAQVSRDLGLAKLRQATEDKITAKRREFAGVTSRIGEIERDYQLTLIEESAEIERQRILKKYTLDEQEAGLLRQKEIDKQIYENRVQQSKIEEAAIQTQLNQLANDEKIFQLRQQTTASTIELENARFNATLSTLQLQEQGLQRELQGLQLKGRAFSRQRELVNAIAQNQIEQAKIQNQVAKLQNQQGIREAEIAQQQIKFQVARIDLEIQLQRIKAQGEKDDKIRLATLAEITVLEEQTLRLTNEMVASGDQRLENAIQIAAQKDIVADNILRGKLESIEANRIEGLRTINAENLARATGQAADEAARFNTNMSAGLPRQVSTGQVGTSMAIDPDVYESVIARGGFKNPFELVEALEKAQGLKNYQTERDAEIAALMGGSGFTPSSSSFGGSEIYSSSATSTPQGTASTVNVNTGPVIEFDGQMYVSMEDFEAAITQLSRLQSDTARSYGSRKYGGIN